MLPNPAKAQGSSLSPVGAPDTAKAPSVWPPTAIGMPPWRGEPICGSAKRLAMKAASVAAFSAAWPLVILYFMTVEALPIAIRCVIAAAPSPEANAIGTPAVSTTSAETLYPARKQVAIAVEMACRARSNGIPVARIARGKRASSLEGGPTMVGAATAQELRGALASCPSISIPQSCQEGAACRLLI